MYLSFWHTKPITWFLSENLNYFTFDVYAHGRKKIMPSFSIYPSPVNIFKASYLCIVKKTNKPYFVIWTKNIMLQSTSAMILHLQYTQCHHHLLATFPYLHELDGVCWMPFLLAILMCFQAWVYWHKALEIHKP